MFLKSIHIKNYNQFENLELDLTYPKGHAKAGEPLEKICIIGDNGTGKTTILELIKEYYKLVTALRPEHVDTNDNAEVLTKGIGKIIFKNIENVSAYGFLASKKFKLLHFPTGTDLSKLNKIKITENTPKPQIPTFGGGSLLDKIKGEVEEENSDEKLYLLTQENLEKAWSEFTEQIESPLIRGQFKTAKVLLVGEDIRVYVNGIVAKESIPLEPGLMAYLREKLGTNTLKLTCQINDDLNIHHSGKIIYDFDNEQTLELWILLKDNIQMSIDRELSYRRKLLQGLNEQSEAELDDIYNKFKQYKKKTPNGYDDLAIFLNPLLNKFHLELNTKINLDKFDEIKFLDLKAKDGTIISVEKWSTGIRQLIYTILPLYTLKPENGIVMIDEAENSLYPNTQRSIIDFYKSVCPDMQLIIATHSPILASSFEPWEVIELKFNEQGKVDRKPYFKGKNHVDNYHIRPSYLRWDSLLTNMFGLDTDSDEERHEMLMELAILKRDLKNSNGADKEALQKKYETLAEQLDWATL